MTAPFGRHDLGRPEAQQQRATELLARSVAVDLLAPIPVGAVDRGDEPTAAISVRVDVEPSTLGRTRRSLDECPETRVVGTASEIRAAAREARRGVYLGTRTAPAPDDLVALHALGLRMIGFGHALAESGSDAALEQQGIGLTARDDRLLRQLDRLGIVVDVAAADRATAFDVAMRAARPIVSSRALVADASAAEADVLRAIASTDGVIGVGPDSDRPGSSAPHAPAAGRTPIVTLLDRVDRVAVLVGSRYVALGIGDVLFADRSLTLPALTNGLVARGYTDDEILGILGENALRVFAAVWG